MEELTQEAAKIDIIVTTEQQLLFSQLLVELKAWNEHTNLTAIREDSAIIKKHFVDSLSVMRALPLSTLSIVDVGSGAGFPGLPLAIMLPNVSIVLIESIAKKCAFLNHAVKALNLSHVQVVHGRAEDLSRRAELHEHFDVATARAVAPLQTLVEYTLPFVKVGGIFIAQKNVATDESALAQKAITTLGGGELRHIPVSITGLTPRELIIISKVKTTPKEFPRAVGVATKKPL